MILGTGIDTAYDYYSSGDIAAVLKLHPHVKRSNLFITSKVFYWLRFGRLEVSIHSMIRLFDVAQVPGGMSWYYQDQDHHLRSPQPPGPVHDTSTATAFH